MSVLSITNEIRKSTHVHMCRVQKKWTFLESAIILWKRAVNKYLKSIGSIFIAVGVGVDADYHEGVPPRSIREHYHY